jgi:hypothetical protein
VVAIDPAPQTPGGFVHRSVSRSSRARPPAAVLLRIGATAALLIAALIPTASPAAAADGPTMEARVLLEGQARVGAWMAIQVRLTNDGPPIVGEMRLSTGQQSRTRFGTPVDLPTTSDKTYVMYAQPPTTFGSSVKVSLVVDEQVRIEQTVDFTVNDPTRLVVGVVAEQPETIIPNLGLLPSGPNGQVPNVIALDLGDLPGRVEAWASLDRLIWQDVDTVDMTADQVTAMRGWLAGGGRLVIAGGTAGPGIFSAFPDDILPFRPTTTLDAPPEAVTSIVGQLPAAATELPVLAGELIRGQALATIGDRAIAAETAYGSGAVTILGFDPTTNWITSSDSTEGLWRQYMPPRATAGFVQADDGQLVNAVSRVPNLALPPIDGLLILLAGYIILIGPVNYLILRRLDRREWAWVTMPVLIAVFAAGSYGFGAALRGLDVVVNEVAIVRGAPNAREGTAQVYLGVFSPSRGTYQLEVPGGALLSSTLTGDFLNSGSAALIDVLQGSTARVRNLAIGVGSLRTLRAETAAPVPLITTDLTLTDGVLRGTITNQSTEKLEKPAVVLGTSFVTLRDLEPGASQQITMVVRPNFSGQSLSNQILGGVFFGDPSRETDTTARNIVRHAVIDHLTFDPNFGSNSRLPAESPVLLAWGTKNVLDVTISGQEPRRTGNVLYYMPLGMRIAGATVFEGDLMRVSVVEQDMAGGFFNFSQNSISLGLGSVTLGYAPVPFEGQITPTRVRLSANWGGEMGGVIPAGRAIEPLDPQPCLDAEIDPVDCVEPEPEPPCDPNTKDCFSVMPEVEVFDRRGGGTWLRLPRLDIGSTYELANPERYVDAATGALLVRFVSDRQDGIGFGFGVRIEGNVQ